MKKRHYKKKQKFNNRKTVVDGISFDSKLESKRYIELKELEKRGLIKDLELQKCFELIPKFKKDGKTYRKACYYCDFCYFDTRESKIIVEDVKGVRTDVFKLKKKLFEYVYPEFTIKEIRNEKLK